MAETKRYYWLKLKKDFFKRHDIRIIEAMPNGKDYVLFYLKLLVESVDHEGSLRFSDTIPYNVNMLATITDTNPDIVRGAMEVFRQLKLVEILDDETIFMAEIEKMLGTETYWAEQKRKKRAEPPKLKDTPKLQIGQCPTSVQDVSNVSNQEKEKDIDLDKDKDIPPLPPKGVTFDKDKQFELFWTAYPRKTAKAAAVKAWSKIKLTPELMASIMVGLNAAKGSDGWMRDGGRFIPHPATWLNGKRWEDEYEKGGGANGTHRNGAGQNAPEVSGKEAGVFSEYGKVDNIPEKYKNRSRSSGN